MRGSPFRSLGLDVLVVLPLAVGGWQVAVIRHDGPLANPIETLVRAKSRHAADALLTKQSASYQRPHVVREATGKFRAPVLEVGA